MVEKVAESLGEGSQPKSGLARVVEGACCVGGLLAALSGNLPVAGVAFSAAESAASTVEHLKRKLDEVAANRILRSAERIRKRAEAEGLDPDAEQMEDTLRATVGPLADAETEDKRRLIEEIVLNSARRNDNPAARAEALRASTLVAAMSPDAALVFATMAKLDRVDCRRQRYRTPEVIAKSSGLPEFLVEEALEKLVGELKLAYAHYDEGQSGEGETFQWLHSASLNPRGDWLAGWVCANAESVARTDASQTPPQPRKARAAKQNGKA